jgi:hypothetical protein
MTVEIKELDTELKKTQSRERLIAENLPSTEVFGEESP